MGIRIYNRNDKDGKNVEFQCEGEVDHFELCATSIPHRNIHISFSRTFKDDSMVMGKLTAKIINAREERMIW